MITPGIMSAVIQAKPSLGNAVMSALKAVASSSMNGTLRLLTLQFGRFQRGVFFKSELFVKSAFKFYQNLNVREGHWGIFATTQTDTEQTAHWFLWERQTLFAMELGIAGSVSCGVNR